MEKKKRIKIPKENKIRAELQKEIDSLCPFCDNSDVGHFEIHHIDSDPSNNENNNLFLLCPLCHSKINKGDIKPAEVYQKKIELLTTLPHKRKHNLATVNFNKKINTAIVGDNNKVTIKQTKKTVKEKYPEGCIGHDTMKANYIGHLIKRYNEYKAIELGKDKVNYAIFGSHLKNQFKIGPTRTIYNVPTDRFDELVKYIHKRIEGTKFGKMNANQRKLYSTFEEYIRQQTQKEIEHGIFEYSDKKYGIFINSTVFFEGRICDTFPGVRGIKEYSNPIECINRLGMLLKRPLKFDISGETAFTDPIWWERGNDGNIQIESFTKLSDTKCLINFNEYEIKRIVVYHSSSRFKNFVYVEATSQSPTGLYPSITTDTIKSYAEEGRFAKEEYAVFNGRLITREEYDDGSAEIDGKVTDISGQAQLRIRTLNPYNFVITAKASSFNCDYPYEKLISESLNKLLKDEINFQTFVDSVENLPRTRFHME